MKWLRHKKTGAIYPFDAILANHHHIESYEPTKGELKKLTQQFKIVEVETQEISTDWLDKIDNLSGVPATIIDIMKAILSMDQNDEEQFNSLGIPNSDAINKVMGKRAHWKHRDKALSVLKDIGYEIKSRGNNPEGSEKA